MVSLLHLILGAGLAAPPRPPAPEVEDAIRTLAEAPERPGWAAGHDRALRRLLERPERAACHLVQDLRPTTIRHLSGYDPSPDRQALAAVWRIRALRFLTACQDFRAPTTDRLSHPDEVGRQFLERRGRRQLPFFAVWMSRDSVYLAPPDTQAAVIARWRRWFADEGSTFAYRACESTDDWYF
jgi:hypothetical protein